MKKALSLVVLVMTFAASYAFAQGLVQRYDSNAIAAPGYTLNSPGSNYGQVYNVATSTSQWALGFGSTKTSNGTPALTWDTNQSILVGPKTSTQISTLGATASGYMLVNITTLGLCVSTGTGPGAWVYISTTGTPTARAVCY